MKGPFPVDAHEGPQVPPPPPPSGVVRCETFVRSLTRSGWANEQDRLWLANEKAKMEARIAKLKQERVRIAAALKAGEISTLEAAL